MKNQVSNARTSFGPLFLQIVKENHKKVLKLDARLRKFEMQPAKRSGEDQVFVAERKIQLLEIELAKASTVVIVFSAMILESYIYDYAARHLTDAFVQEHLDRLDPLSKWIKVPKLITGKELPNHQNWRQLLRRLIKTRNSVIHHKSSQPPTKFNDIKKYFETLQADSVSLLAVAKQSTQLLEILAGKIIEIDPEETPWVKSYLA